MASGIVLSVPEGNNIQIRNLENNLNSYRVGKIKKISNILTFCRKYLHSE